MLDSFSSMVADIAAHPWHAVTVIVSLILIESLLSIDNAAVLATMVMVLPEEQRSKALRYGILGAYVFRGICLIFAAWLIDIWWFKPLGGLYLLWMGVSHFFEKHKSQKEVEEEAIHEIEEKKKSWLYRKTLGAFGPFWATVILVEVMDLAFSIDNVLAANAYSKNLLLIWIGVFIGIASMRLVAAGFVKLLQKYPFLTTSAYFVIILLGLKLTLSVFGHFYPCSALTIFLEGNHSCLLANGQPISKGEHPIIWGDIITTVGSLGIFLFPLLYVWLFKRPKANDDSINA